ncbi:hypothetical protein CEXT_425471, partial [Caerostris extrusa]
MECKYSKTEFIFRKAYLDGHGNITIRWYFEIYFSCPVIELGVTGALMITCKCSAIDGFAHKSLAEFMKE